jgi:hypothetical protein
MGSRAAHTGEQISSHGNTSLCRRLVIPDEDLPEHVEPVEV